MAEQATPRGILDDAPVAVVSVDLSRRIDSWNREAERVFGWPAAEVVGRDPLELIADSVAGDVGEAVWDELLASGRWAGEIELRRRDGSTFPAFASAATARDPSGQPTRIIGTVVDLTERRRLDGRLIEAEERYRTLVERLPLVVYIETIDPDAPPLYISPQVEAWLGYPLERWLTE